MGFLSKLFGGSKASVKKEVEPIEYNGFLIYPEPIAEGGQFRIAGQITKEIDGEVKSHRFIRSDVLSSESDACELMVKKSKMFIDQSSGKIF
ncbi:HlyU family transcriptional regulator [Vibrio litoralis]|uniref:HlyU family transcriptional regulator n=1 Tax=Vibrio litoralis TaxID=335972 RepID=UPI000410A45B|nr:HlyU family transcriptional regulator [Vibrio litoralis]